MGPGTYLTLGEGSGVGVDPVESTAVFRVSGLGRSP